MPCDTAEYCTGTSANCPPDVYTGFGTVCRGTSGSCDAVEQCTGSSPYCPADIFQPVGTLCRSAAGTCDAEEYCVGTRDCPANGFMAWGRSAWRARTRGSVAGPPYAISAPSAARASSAAAGARPRLADRCSARSNAARSRAARGRTPTARAPARRATDSRARSAALAAASAPGTGPIA
jgi:hypothetical protein